jgi:hypothetical protein
MCIEVCDRELGGHICKAIAPNVDMGPIFSLGSGVASGTPIFEIPDIETKKEIPYKRFV